MAVVAVGGASELGRYCLRVRAAAFAAYKVAVFLKVALVCFLSAANLPVVTALGSMNANGLQIMRRIIEIFVCHKLLSWFKPAFCIALLYK